MTSASSSRFAVLKNFGDSDEENDGDWKKVAPTKGATTKTKIQPVPKPKDTSQPSLSLPVGLSSLVVAPSAAHKKNKKKKSAKSESPDESQQLQEEDEELRRVLMVSKMEVEQMNQRWREDERNTKLALKNSLEGNRPTAPKTPRKEPKSPEPPERIAESPEADDTDADQMRLIQRQVDEEIARVAGESDRRESVVVAVYKSKLEETVRVNVELKTEVDRLQKDLASSKDRIKKLCRVMGEGESREKIQILVELEKTQAVRDDLTKEVAELNGHLQQAKSRISELEAELKRTQQALGKPHPHQHQK